MTTDTLTLWKRTQLKEICQRIDYGYTAGAKQEQVGPKFLRITDIVPQLINWDSVPFCEIHDDDLGKYELREGDIVIARTGATSGYAKTIKRHPRAVFASYLVRIRIKREHDWRYVGLVVESDEYKRFIKAVISGAAQPQANAQVLTSFPMPIPPLPIQRKIAAILSAYDDLIENNTHRIKILEEMAQMTYREWFVNLRFPGHENVKMVESELGLVPEGWEVKKVGAVVHRLKAGTVYTESMVSATGNFPVIDQSQGGFLGFHNNHPAHLATPENPIIIFGDHTCKMQLLTRPFSIGPNVVPFTGEAGVPIYYLFFLVRALVSTQEYKRHWTELMNKTVVVAPSEIGIQFGECIRASFELIDNVNRRNLNLRRTRELLLPKLISGELDVDKLSINAAGAGND